MRTFYFREVVLLTGEKAYLWFQSDVFIFGQEALIRVHVVPRFINQPINFYTSCYMSCYLVFNHSSKSSKDVRRIFVGTMYAIRCVHGNRAIESRSFPRSTWFIFMLRIRDDCTFTIPRERQSKRG